MYSTKTDSIMPTKTTSTLPFKQKKHENTLLNLGLNIILPALLLMKGNVWFGFNPTMALCVALAFPTSYGVYDFITRKKYNIFSILGFMSVLLTGGIALLKLPKEYIAIKEAAVPLIIGLAVLISLKTRYPLIRTLLYNEAVINTENVERALHDKGNKSAFERLLVKCTWLISLSFLLSAILNFALAKIIVTSESGTQAFTEQLGKMAIWSYPVIVLPSTLVMVLALWKLVGGIRFLTNLQLEDIFNNFDKQKTS